MQSAYSGGNTERGFDFNVVTGFCVGYGALVCKHSESLVTSMVVKDLMPGHNLLLPLYPSGSSYKKIMSPRSGECELALDSEIVSYHRFWIW